MSVWKIHDIRRLSYSHVEMFRTDPAAWLMRYPMRIRGSTNANMARGNAVEAALEWYLTDEFGVATVSEAVERAKKDFKKETALVVDKEDREKQLEQIEGYVTQAIEAFKPFGTPIGTQNELTIDIGEDIPVIGFDDFEFAGEPKLSIDLKTTARCPSAMPDNHKRQGALYQAMRPEHKIMFCYVTPKKHAIYELDAAEARQLFEDFKITVRRIKQLLALSNDPHELASIFAPNYSSFYWNDPIMRAEGKRIFGL
jgi:hypothetical protein